MTGQVGRDLAGASTVVTGAAGGIGAAFARVLLERLLDEAEMQRAAGKSAVCKRAVTCPELSSTTHSLALPPAFSAPSSHSALVCPHPNLDSTGVVAQ